MLGSILRRISAVLEQPVLLVLVVMVIFTLYTIGGLIGEWLERRYLNIKVPKVLDAIKKNNKEPMAVIYKSGLLKKQKELLYEVSVHKELSPEIRETLALRLLDEYKSKLDMRVKLSDLITKLAPAFGLMGTLIPLGPGIIALSSGDTQTLSQSLLIAFDTTIVGLLCATVNTVITTIRKKWYANDMSMMSTLMESLLEAENNYD